MQVYRLTYVSGTCAASIFMVDTEVKSYISGLQGMSTIRTMEVAVDFGPGCKNCETVKLRHSEC